MDAVFFVCEWEKIINLNHIRWVKEDTNGCYNICTKDNGCLLVDTHLICSDHINYENFIKYINDNSLNNK
jgi:hypothetical protein